MIGFLTPEGGIISGMNALRLVKMEAIADSCDDYRTIQDTQWVPPKYYVHVVLDCLAGCYKAVYTREKPAGEHRFIDGGLLTAVHEADAWVDAQLAQLAAEGPIDWSLQ